MFDIFTNKIKKDKYDIKKFNIINLENISTEHVLESYIKNEDDIYYNKEKFDSGEINLCFITGHSGSGKSTLGNSMEKENKNIEFYQLDDLIFNDNFSMENLKEYGELIYTFFTGNGKKFKINKDTSASELNSKFKNYEKEIIESFINFSIQYANSHKNKKFVLDGIWLFLFIEPSKLKEYAVYIKGTSSLLSLYRAAKRDFKNEENHGIKRISKIFSRIFSDLQNMSDFEARINKYRTYFKKLENSVTQESGLLFFDESGDYVSTIKTNQFNEITDFIICENYKGCGLALPILKEAVDILNTEVIHIEKDDIISKKLCESIGFFEEYCNENTTYMTLPDYMLGMFLEAQDDDTTYFIRDNIYPLVHNVLSTPQGDRKFKRLVEQFVDRNSVKLHEPCPISQIPFMDSDKRNFMECFNTTETELVRHIKQMTSSVSTKANFKLIHQNPIFSLFYCVIRYYTINKDEKGLYTALVIYALASYPSVFDKYFKHGANKGVMLYTADKLTNKFIIKQKGHVYGALTESIRSSYNFLQEYFKDGSDKEVIRFIQRIRNDQNSMLKKISGEYYENYKKGLSVYTTTDSFDDNNFVDDVSNNTAVVQDNAQKIVNSLITNGIDLQRAETAAKWAQISIVDCRFYLYKIITKENVNDLNKFIESILFIYLYDEHHEPYEIRSKEFLAYAIRLFRKTNSNDSNIKRINTLLNKWAEDSGIYTRYKREASRINYKKGIFWYIILCIQKYV